MAITVASRQREERGVLMQQLREEWWQLRRAVQANRPEAVTWRLQRIEKSKAMHKLTLAELLVAGGSIR